MKKLFLVVLSLVLISCGGGGGGGGSSADTTEADLTASNAKQAGDAALQVLDITGVAGDTSSLNKVSGSAEKNGFLVKIMRTGLSQLDRSDKLAKTVQSSCPGGGGIIATGEYPSVTVVLNNCADGTESMNGTMNLAYTSVTAFTATFSNLAYADSATNDNFAVNGVFEYSSITLNNQGDIASFSCRVTGSASGAFSGRQASQQYRNLTMAVNFDSSSASVTLSGAVKPGCLGGWITLSTSSPIVIPYGGSCPTGGDISATSKGNTVRVVTAINSNISVYYNGVLTGTYNNCSDVRGTCI